MCIKLFKKQVLNFDPESYNNKTTQDWETLVFQKNTWRDVERTNPTSVPQDANFGYVTLVTESLNGVIARRMFIK